VAQTCPQGMFLIFLKGCGGLISHQVPKQFPSNSSCSHQYLVICFLFASSSQKIPVKFLLFPSITHQNAFVLIKFQSNSFCSHQVPIKFLLFPSSSHPNPFVLMADVYPGWGRAESRDFLPARFRV